MVIQKINIYWQKPGYKQEIFIKETIQYSIITLIINCIHMDISTQYKKSLRSELLTKTNQIH